MSSPAVGERVAVIYLATAAPVETRLGVMVDLCADPWIGYFRVALDSIGDGGHTVLCNSALRDITWCVGELPEARETLVAAYLLYISGR